MCRIYVMAVVLALISMTFLAGHLSLAQDDSTPFAGSSPVGTSTDNLFVAEGIDAPISASTDVDELTVSDPHLVLERIEIPATADSTTHTAAAPELLLVEDGELSFEDGFGFSSTVDADEQLAINADASYTLFNDSDDSVSVLRLSLTSPEAESTQGTPVSTGQRGATPVPADSAEVLIDRSVDALPSTAATMFISQATLAPGSESGEQGHAGPLGIYVEDGILSVQSPSGAAGQLKPESGVVLPENASLAASNEGDVEAVVLLVGVVESGPSLVTEVTPEPTATLAPTATTPPTQTPLPTATTAPTQTPLPTATVASTATTAPTPTPTMPVAGTILYKADTSGGLEALDAGAGWNLVDGMLVSDGTSGSTVYAPFDPNGLADYAIEAEIQFVRTNGPRGFSLLGRSGDSGSVSLYAFCGYRGFNSITCDERHQGVALSILDANDPDQTSSSELGNGREVYTPGDTLAAQQFTDDGDWHTYRLELDGNQIRGLIDGAIVLTTQDNRLLDPGLAALAVREETQINVRAFRVIALGNGTADSSNTSAASGQTETSNTTAAANNNGQQVTSSGNTDSVVITAFLPSQDEVPSHLVMADDRSRALDEVVSNYSDPEATADLFRSWGWQGNVVRSFAPPGGTLDDPTRVGGIYVSIHELGSPTAAAEALDYSLEVQAEGTALFEVDAPVYGDYCRALYGQVDYQGDGSYYQNEITYLVQSGNFFIRLSVASPEGDPTKTAQQVMESMMSF